MSLSIKRRLKPQVNLIALIDVLSLLIFFFLMTMQFRYGHVLSITPPKIETASPSIEKNILRLYIDPSGSILADGHPLLATNLRSFFDDHVKAGATSLVLTVDENTPLKYVTLAMDQARQAHLIKINLQSR